MIYFLVTTSLFNNNLTRKIQYTYGINKLKEVITLKNITNYKIIIIENNDKRETFLDKLNCIYGMWAENLFQYCAVIYATEL